MSKLSTVSVGKVFVMLTTFPPVPPMMSGTPPNVIVLKLIALS